MLLDDDFPQKTRLTLTRCSLSPQGQTTVESDEFSAMLPYTWNMGITRVMMSSQSASAVRP